MAQKTKKKTRRVNRSPDELLQAEYEKSQLRAMADNGSAAPMDVLVSQGAFFAEEPEPLPAPVSVPAPLSKDDALVLNVSEVCALLKISRRTLERSNVPGKVKIGGSVRYHRETIEKWILQQMQPSP